MVDSNNGGRCTAAIRVAVRVRPFDERELSTGAKAIVECVSKLNQVRAVMGVWRMSFAGVN
jgi:hypothetical protein